MPRISTDDLLNENYVRKLNGAQKAYKLLKDYVSYYAPDKADNAMEAFCLHFLSSDGIISNTETGFFNDFLFKCYSQEELTARYKKDKEDGVVDRLISVLKKGTLDTRMEALKLAGYLISCDKEISQRELEALEALEKKLF